ncbi:MAG: helix-turn-helix transcriptional regulator [Bdellovibrionota bacterium]
MGRPRVKGISHFFREKRTAAGLTQFESATNLGHSTAQYISNLERGLCEPSLEMALKLCDMYSVPKRELYDLLLEVYEQELKKRLFGKATKKR